MQRIQYAKTKSDCIAKEEGSFVPRDKKRKQEERGDLSYFKILYSLEAFNSMSDNNGIAILGLE